jgi:hypothetical protein
MVTTGVDNPFPSILIVEGTEPAAPAAGRQRLYIDSTTHLLKITNSSGTESTVGPPMTRIEYTLASADVALTTANTFYDGPTGTPAAGTYDALGIFELEMTGSNTDSAVVRLITGTSTVVDERETGITPGASAAQGYTGMVSARVILNGSTAIRLAAASLRGGGIMKRDPSRGSSALHRATVLILVQVV